MHARWTVLVAALALAACDRNPEGSGHPVTELPARDHAEAAEHPAAPALPADDARGIAGGLSWQADEPLVYRRPANDMRAAEYGVRDHADTELTVFHFARMEGGGGDVQSNIGRWLGQFTQPDGRPTRDVATIAHREVNDLRVTTVDVGGTFAGRMGMGSDTGSHEGWRMLAAIVEGPEGLVFFKLIGPADGVGAAAEAFEGLVTSLHPV
jgi:hypothetical protein